MAYKGYSDSIIKAKAKELGVSGVSSTEYVVRTLEREKKEAEKKASKPIVFKSTSGKTITLTGSPGSGFKTPEQVQEIEQKIGKTQSQKPIQEEATPKSKTTTQVSSVSPVSASSLKKQQLTNLVRSPSQMMSSLQSRAQEKREQELKYMNTYSASEPIKERGYFSTFFGGIKKGFVTDKKAIQNIQSRKDESFKQRLENVGVTIGTVGSIASLSTLPYEKVGARVTSFIVSKPKLTKVVSNIPKTVNKGLDFLYKATIAKGTAETAYLGATGETEKALRKGVSTTRLFSAGSGIKQGSKDFIDSLRYNAKALTGTKSTEQGLIKSQTKTIRSSEIEREFLGKVKVSSGNKEITDVSFKGKSTAQRQELSDVFGKFTAEKETGTIRTAIDKTDDVFKTITTTKPTSQKLSTSIISSKTQIGKGTPISSVSTTIDGKTATASQIDGVYYLGKSKTFKVPKTYIQRPGSRFTLTKSELKSTLVGKVGSYQTIPKTPKIKVKSINSATSTGSVSQATTKLKTVNLLGSGSKSVAIQTVSKTIGSLTPKITGLSKGLSSLVGLSQSTTQKQDIDLKPISITKTAKDISKSRQRTITLPKVGLTLREKQNVILNLKTTSKIGISPITKTRLGFRSTQESLTSNITTFPSITRSTPKYVLSKIFETPIIPRIDIKPKKESRSKKKKERDLFNTLNPWSKVGAKETLSTFRF